MLADDNILTIDDIKIYGIERHDYILSEMYRFLVKYKREPRKKDMSEITGFPLHSDYFFIFGGLDNVIDILKKICNEEGRDIPGVKICKNCGKFYNKDEYCTKCFKKGEVKCKNIIEVDNTINNSTDGKKDIIATEVIASKKIEVSNKSLSVELVTEDENKKIEKQKRKKFLHVDKKKHCIKYVVTENIKKYFSDRKFFNNMKIKFSQLKNNYWSFNFSHESDKGYKYFVCVGLDDEKVKHVWLVGDIYSLYKVYNVSSSIELHSRYEMPMDLIILLTNEIEKSNCNTLK